MEDWHNDKKKGVISFDKKVLIRLTIVLSVLLMVCVCWYFFSPPESRGVVYIQNSGGAVRAVPTDPGGFKANDRGLEVYRLIDRAGEKSGKKEVRSEERDSNHYYTIHSDVVNIYPDSDSKVVKKEPLEDRLDEGGTSELDIGTFLDRKHALDMVRSVEKKEPYKTELRDYEKQIVISERLGGKNKYYVVSVVELSREKARELASNLKKHGKDALVRG